MDGRRLRRRVAHVVAGALAVAVCAALAVGTAAMALLGDTVKSYLGTDVVNVSTEEREATMAAGRALAERVEAEGIVLVRNVGRTLPLRP